MKRSRSMICFALLVPVAFACGRTINTVAEVHAIRDTETKWNQDFTARDVERLVDHYTDDAVLMAPGMPPSVGRKDIRKFLTGMVGDPALSLKFSAARINVSASGDLAYSQGSYLMTMTDQYTKRVVHDYGSYVTTYRREADGTWKAVTDIATSEAGPQRIQPSS